MPNEGARAFDAGEDSGSSLTNEEDDEEAVMGDPAAGHARLRNSGLSRAGKRAAAVGRFESALRRQRPLEEVSADPRYSRADGGIVQREQPLEDQLATRALSDLQEVLANEGARACDAGEDSGSSLINENDGEEETVRGGPVVRQAKLRNSGLSRTEKRAAPVGRLESAGQGRRAAPLDRAPRSGTTGGVFGAAAAERHRAHQAQFGAPRGRDPRGVLGAAVEERHWAHKAQALAPRGYSPRCGGARGVMSAAVAECHGAGQSRRRMGEPQSGTQRRRGPNPAEEDIFESDSDGQEGNELEEDEEEEYGAYHCKWWPVELTSRSAALASRVRILHPTADSQLELELPEWGPFSEENNAGHLPLGRRLIVEPTRFHYEGASDDVVRVRNGAGQLPAMEEADSCSYDVHSQLHVDAILARELEKIALQFGKEHELTHLHTDAQGRHAAAWQGSCDRQLAQLAIAVAEAEEPAGRDFKTPTSSSGRRRAHGGAGVADCAFASVAEAARTLKAAFAVEILKETGSALEAGMRAHAGGVQEAIERESRRPRPYSQYGPDHPRNKTKRALHIARAWIDEDDPYKPRARHIVKGVESALPLSESPHRRKLHQRADAFEAAEHALLPVAEAVKTLIAAVAVQTLRETSVAVQAAAREKELEARRRRRERVGRGVEARALAWEEQRQELAHSVKVETPLASINRSLGSPRLKCGAFVEVGATWPGPLASYTDAI